MAESRLTELGKRRSRFIVVTLRSDTRQRDHLAGIIHDNRVLAVILSGWWVGAKAPARHAMPVTLANSSGHGEEEANFGYGLAVLETLSEDTERQGFSTRDRFLT